MKLMCENFFMLTIHFFCLMSSFKESHSQSVNEDDFGQSLKFSLEHELVKGQFTKRGQLSVRSYASEIIHYRDEASLTDQELQSLIKLAEANEIYRVRVLFTVANRAEYVYGFMYACDLLHGGLRDNLTLSFNTHGALVGVQLSVHDAGKATYAACTLGPNLRSPSALPRHFVTHAVASRPVQGPAPETQIYIARVEEEKKRKQEAEQGDNRPFIMKYWMYIVPAVLVFMMMSGANDPNAQGGGGS